MNKKRLSVVMAGAMLASSVAPVLAAEVQKSEVSANELGLLMDELRTLVESKTFSKIDENGDLKGDSVYAIYVNDKIAVGKDGNPLDVYSTQEDWQKVFNNLDADDKVQVWSKGFKEVDGVVYANENKPAVYATYKTKEDLIDLANNINKRIFDETITGGPGSDYTVDHYGPLSGLMDKNAAEYDAQTGRVVITFKKNIGLNGAHNNTISIGLNDRKIDITQYLDEKEDKHYITRNTTCGMFYGFAKSDEKTQEAGPQDIASELVREITITPGGYDLTVEELYDGLMLTEKGHDFFNTLKEARAMRGEYILNGNNVDSKGRITEGNVATEIKMIGGKARFTVTFPAKNKLAKETYTITGLNEANAERLAKWMVKPLARVDILAGSNRYETAVEIAKEYAGLTGPEANYNNETYKDIVLVNGNALVDGLAAAPLAATKTNWKYNEKGQAVKVSAPILLTEADALPKATKAYLKELMADHLVGGKETAKIHLVGGEAVLNKSLERELRSLGFEVERYSGDNREETSLAVAKEIGLDEAFVVGAEGEADAMSIAAVAAETKTPIVVAKKGGITEDATYELRKSDVTVIGGENAVSKADYNAIARISGSNRQATNAEIVKKYYKNNFLRAENIIVAKDGKANKAELVDALAAANMASEKNAPIVLATDKLSKDQLNALLLNAKNAEALYQVGHGVARDVVKTIATQLGLTNR